MGESFRSPPGFRATPYVGARMETTIMRSFPVNDLRRVADRRRVGRHRAGDVVDIGTRGSDRAREVGLHVVDREV